MRCGLGGMLCKRLFQGLHYLMIYLCNGIGDERMAEKLEVYLKGKRLPMNKFVESVINDVMIALLSNLRDVEIDKISKIEIE